MLLAAGMTHVWLTRYDQLVDHTPDGFYLVTDTASQGMACVDKKLKAPLKQGNVLCHKWVSQAFKTRIIMGDDHCSVVHYLISWWAEGVPDIGFSLCTAPTYCQCLSIFQVKSQGFGLMPKDVRQRWQA